MLSSVSICICQLVVELSFVVVCFRKRLQKQNITFHPNDTVSYLEYRSYYFEPSMSVGNESDVVTIPNMLVLVRQHCCTHTMNWTSIALPPSSLPHFIPFLPILFFPLPSVFQGAAVMMENMPIAVRLLLSATFKGFKEGPFLSKSVGELMWGYDSKLVDFLNKWLPGMLPSTGKFGLFAEVSGRARG